MGQVSRSTHSDKRWGNRKIATGARSAGWSFGRHVFWFNKSFGQLVKEKLIGVHITRQFCGLAETGLPSGKQGLGDRAGKTVEID